MGARGREDRTPTQRRFAPGARGPRPYVAVGCPTGAMTAPGPQRDFALFPLLGIIEGTISATALPTASRIQRGPRPVEGE